MMFWEDEATVAPGMREAFDRMAEQARRNAETFKRFSDFTMIDAREPVDGVYVITTLR